MFNLRKTVGAVAVFATALALSAPLAAQPPCLRQAPAGPPKVLTLLILRPPSVLA